MLYRDTKPERCNRTVQESAAAVTVGGSIVGASLLAIQDVRCREQARSPKFNCIDAAKAQRKPNSPDAFALN